MLREGQGVGVMSRSMSPEFRSALHRLRHLSCHTLLVSTSHHSGETRVLGQRLSVTSPTAPAANG